MCVSEPVLLYWGNEKKAKKIVITFGRKTILFLCNESKHITV